MIIFADASGTTSLTPAAAGAALELEVDTTSQLHQRHLTGATIFGDAVNDTHQAPRDQAHHVWVVVDAAVDFQTVRRLAQQPLHKATDSSLGTQALHLWTALRRLPKHVVLHLVKQESHLYSLGNGHIDLHAHNQLAEHMPDGEDPLLRDHKHTHLQHLPPIPRPGEPPPLVTDDRIYNDTGGAYHYPQPIRTMAHIRGSQADSALLSRLQHAMRTALYFSALDPSLIPVHLQTRRAQLLLEQLPLLDRVARWYAHLRVCERYRHTPGIHHMPLPSPTARNMGALQTLPISPRGQPPGHVGTGEHHNATRRMGPGHATGKRGSTPDAATGNQGGSTQGSGATPALQGRRRPRPRT